MEAARRSAEYIFQGRMYFYRPKKIVCRYQFSLHDPVEPALLQAALDAVLARAPYYRVRLVWEEREAFLEPNPNPCTVYPGSAMRAIPEQTNDYLFCVSCEGDTLYFDWYHFLMDGHGVSPFLTQLLEEYCNRRYGTAFACPPLVCSPAYDIEALMERYPFEEMPPDGMQRQVLDTCEGRLSLSRVRLDKQSLVRRAVELGVKPFTALCLLLCQAMQLYFGKDTILYSYSTDTRREVGAPDALYNCVASFQAEADLSGGARLEDLAQPADAAIRATLQPEAKLRRMAQQMGWVYKVAQQNAPLRIQSRIFQMGEYLSGVPADFWLSYLGNPLIPANPALEPLLRDFQVWVPPDGGSLCVEASTLNGVLTLCLENKAERPGLSAAVRTALEREGIRVLEALELGETPVG